MPLHKTVEWFLEAETTRRDLQEHADPARSHRCDILTILPMYAAYAPPATVSDLTATSGPATSTTAAHSNRYSGSSGLGFFHGHACTNGS
jgi:hypothetical protein